MAKRVREALKEALAQLEHKKEVAKKASQAYQERQAQKGLCAKSSKHGPAAPGRTLCQSYLDATRERVKAKRGPGSRLYRCSQCKQPGHRASWHKQQPVLDPAAEPAQTPTAAAAPEPVKAAVKVFVPILISSENQFRRQSWQAIRAVTKRERAAVKLALFNDRDRLPPLPATITLTRIGVRFLDSDNLQGALKAVRDEVAVQIGADDADPRLVWRYEQEIAKERREWGIRVEISP